MASRSLYLAREQRVYVDREGASTSHGAFTVILCRGPQPGTIVIASLDVNDEPQTLDEASLNAEYCTSTEGVHTHICVLARINRDGVAVHVDRVPDASFITLAPHEKKKALMDRFNAFRSRPGWTSFMKTYDFMTDVEGIIANKK